LLDSSLHKKFFSARDVPLTLTAKSDQDERRRVKDLTPYYLESSKDLTPYYLESSKDLTPYYFFRVAGLTVPRPNFLLIRSTAS
jgi:hypothetical protein